jgi:fructose-bisphosphate aldolase class I
MISLINKFCQSKLNSVAKVLVASGKGILAADESDNSIKKRFDPIGLESTPENHRLYRQLLFKTPDIEKYISGIILFDETIRQSTDENIPFADYLNRRGIIPGIKVDKGTKEFGEGGMEKITEGIEGLPQRLEEYKTFGAAFTKWRAVIAISEGKPSNECIEKNAELLSQFAKISQEYDMVPIVEPEVLMDGDHDLGRCEEVTYKTLKKVFEILVKSGVDISGMLLKPNMVIKGKENSAEPSSKEVAEATIRCFSEAGTHRLVNLLVGLFGECFGLFRRQCFLCSYKFGFDGHCKG